jgi:membrane-associated phospholipid phosphatase
MVREMATEWVMAAAAIIALLWALLGDDFRAWSPGIARRLIRISAGRLPAPVRRAYEKKWLTELEELPEGAVWSQIGLAVIKYLALAPHLDGTFSPGSLRGQRATFDTKVLYAMRTRGHGRRAEAIAVMATKAGRNGLVWLFVNLVLAAIDSTNREAWLTAALLAPVTILLIYPIRLMVGRPRPVLDGLPPLGGSPSSLSFPSAYAASSFAVAVAMTRIDPATSGSFLVATTISLSRPYLGQNYLSDVLAGAVLGGVLGLIAPLSM